MSISIGICVYRYLGIKGLLFGLQFFKADGHDSFRSAIAPSHIDLAISRHLLTTGNFLNTNRSSVSSWNRDGEIVEVSSEFLCSRIDTYDFATKIKPNGDKAGLENMMYFLMYIKNGDAHFVGNYPLRN